MPTTVTVTVKDDTNRVTVYETELPAEQGRELDLATTALRNMQTAEVFLRMCTLGLDVFLKEFGQHHLKFVIAEIKRLLDE